MTEPETPRIVRVGAEVCVCDHCCRDVLCTIYAFPDGDPSGLVVTTRICYDCVEGDD